MKIITDGFLSNLKTWRLLNNILKGAYKELVGYARYKYRILRGKLAKIKINVK